MVSNNSNYFCDEFQGGRLKNYVKAWESTIEDTEIAEAVSGLKLDFIDNLLSCSIVSELGFSKKEETAIDDEIGKLLARRSL